MKALKYAVVMFVFVAMLFFWFRKEEVPMSNLLGDDLIAYVDGRMTDPTDIELLRQRLNRVEPITSSVAGWLPVGNNPRFSTIEAQSGLFDIVPINGSMFKMDTTQSMTSGGEVIVWNGTNIYNQDSMIVPYNSPITKFHINPSFSLRNSGFGIGEIHVAWSEPLATTVFIRWYKKSDDSYLGASVPVQFTFTVTTNPLMLPYDTIASSFSLNPSLVYFTIDVVQNSGVDKDLFSRVIFYRIQ